MSTYVTSIKTFNVNFLFHTEWTLGWKSAHRPTQPPPYSDLSVKYPRPTFRVSWSWDGENGLNKKRCYLKSHKQLKRVLSSKWISRVNAGWTLTMNNLVLWSLFTHLEWKLQSSPQTTMVSVSSSTENQTILKTKSNSETSSVTEETQTFKTFGRHAELNECLCDYKKTEVQMSQSNFGANYIVTT